ncbi:hypothetical protein ABVV53_03045 [Novosphingobium sp. RD2P27]|uniref:Flap endonuclease-1-like 5' DNA nuclease n=1 Tax=Novosphingobium kalidii TaxID=3230299 RepID=A0ABV2CXY2_9SPHN
MIEANWLIFVAVLVIALIIAWWLFGRAAKPSVRKRRPDVLDEGASPAQRNQALIDAPPAAAVPPPAVTPPAAAGLMAGIGEVVVPAARDEVAAAKEEEASAEASPPEVTTSEAPSAPTSPAEAPVEAPLAAAGEPDDLRRIKGIGPKLLTTLHALGVNRFEHIASWTDADLDALDNKLGAFAGRPRRDSWVEQARLLSSGDTAAYEAKFGKL